MSSSRLKIQAKKSNQGMIDNTFLQSKKPTFMAEREKNIPTVNLWKLSLCFSTDNRISTELSLHPKRKTPAFHSTFQLSTK